MTFFISAAEDMDMNDGAPEPDQIINHLNENHYGSDSLEEDPPSGPADRQENHTATDHQDLLHGDEEENGQPQAEELPPGCEGGAVVVLGEDQPPRYLSPAALKKHIHTETTKVNNELRALITKEIRKPGRRMYPNIMWRGGAAYMRAWIFMDISLILLSMPQQHFFDILIKEI